MKSLSIRSKSVKRYFKTEFTLHQMLKSLAISLNYSLYKSSTISTYTPPPPPHHHHCQSYERCGIKSLQKKNNNNSPKQGSKDIKSKGLLSVKKILKIRRKSLLGRQKNRIK